MPRTGQRRPGCENCRLRHLKCDGGKPCSRCAKKNLSCDRNLRVRFKHSSHSGTSASQHKFASTQTWCKTAKNLRFLDQTLEIVRSYDEPESDEDSNEAPFSTSPAGPVPTSVSASIWARQKLLSDDNDLDRCSSEKESPCISFGNEPDLSPELPCGQNDSLSPEDMHYLQQISTTQHIGTEGNSPYSAVRRSISGPYPLLTFHAHTSPVSIDGHWKDYDKEQLFRHFVNDLGPAFDLCDSSRTLANELAEQAAMSAPLLNLVLAVSSRHLSGATDLGLFPEHTFDFYRYQYIAETAGPESRGMHETHLAIAALLLRLFQNIESVSSTVPSIPFDLYFNSKSTSSERFLQAIFWARLQQELYLAVMSQTAMQLNLEAIDTKNFIPPYEDEAWSKQMLLYLVATVQYCFGDVKDPVTYDILLSQALAWADSKPDSFTPVYLHQPEDGAKFPEVWLLDDSIAAGLQYYHLVRILLTSHNPRVPRLGAAQKKSTRWIDDQIKADVKIICGIAESMDDISPTHLTACMTIGLVGDRFTQRAEQTALFNILMKTTKKYGWSTTLAQKQLQEAWGWAQISEIIT